MHHLEVKTKEYGTVSVNHNGDWSGIAIITWNDIKHHEVHLPAAILVALGRDVAAKALSDRVISAIESWEP